MRLRGCSLLLLFMSLCIAAKGSTEDSPPGNFFCEADSRKSENVCMSSDKPKQGESNNAKNVLIYNPHLGHHHIRFMTTIANQLKAEGHKVTMLDSKVFVKLKVFNKTEGIKIVPVEQCDVAKEKEKNQDTGLKPFWDDLPWTTQLSGFLSYYKLDLNFCPIMSQQCSAILNVAIPELENTKFDLAITEVFDFCGLGIFDILKPTKIILASSVPLHELIGEWLGLPKALDSIPTKFSVGTIHVHREEYREFDSKGFAENAIGSALFGQTMFGYLEASETTIFKEYYEKEGLGEFPGIKKLLKNAHSLMENVHPLLDLNKPTLNAIIPIGGITVQDVHTHLSETGKERLKEIKDKMREAKKNNHKVVLVSFGTVMDNSTMTKATKENIVKALQDVKEATFFWYLDDPILKEKLQNGNVKPYDWLPQEQLLASGQVDLFVSHMGIGSMTEGAYNGVPFVSVPLFVDQHYNYVCAKRLGIAKFVDKASLANSPSTLKNAIEEALKNDTMRTKSTQLKMSLESFGNQTKTMIDHINFILSLDENEPPLAFEHHHHGFSLSQSLRSLIHLTPYYACPLAIIASFLLVFMLRNCWRRRKEFVKELKAHPLDGFVRTTFLSVGCYVFFFGVFYPFIRLIAAPFIDYFASALVVFLTLVLFPIPIFLWLSVRCVGSDNTYYGSSVTFWFTIHVVLAFVSVLIALFLLSMLWVPLGVW